MVAFVNAHVRPDSLALFARTHLAIQMICVKTEVSALSMGMVSTVSVRVALAVNFVK